MNNNGLTGLSTLVDFTSEAQVGVTVYVERLDHAQALRRENIKTMSTLFVLGVGFGVPILVTACSLVTYMK